ncbi:LAO/AO transport system kinase [Kineosphaera limosa]|uniref:Putative GTPase n=1 Tax=Kineosphaera limosa NBRC 100340 TaxID=1184609 RepID=K6W6X2_9MICO|nr:methylmalonyl Co-A mutase-associated GTPase MeaB [Kineosphaera limosa]NYE00589.1 LAO/AO transport system kinase [Kineosphaera limosa]GAB94945.1 putative GTPase [Kineosphaera limosa NBRC 100340]
MADPYDVDILVEGVLAGRRLQLARAITLVESSRPDHRQRARLLLQRLLPAAGQAVRVGISGVPGAGKSTFIDALGSRLVRAGHKVAVLAVDPSSSRTGGSILGDRTRMAELAASDNAFVRPSPSGGQLGGVARATRESMTVLEAAGFDVVIVETVGVGQSEVAVGDMVDTFLMLALARAGDQLQGIKRGILERVDVIAVNKADGDQAGEARVCARELRGAMRLMTGDSAKAPEVLTCSALTGDGLDEVWEKVTAHRAALVEAGSLAQRRADQQRSWLHTLTESELLDALRSSPQVRAARAEVEAGMTDGTVSAPEGSQRLIETFYATVRAVDPRRAHRPE